MAQSLLLSTQLLQHYRQLSHQVFTVIDVETTGRLPRQDRVIELSVLQASLQDGIQFQQTHLLNPQVPIPPQITQFTGITQAMVNAALPTAEVLPQYSTTLNQHVLTAHNLPFDYAFLQAEFARLGTEFIRPDAAQFCTVQLSRLMLAELPSRSLPDLVRYFGFDVTTSHRAAADTLACWLLAKRLLSEIQSEPDEVLLAKLGQQWIRLRDAAAILGDRSSSTKALLERRGVRAKASKRSNAYLYRRADVERIFWEEVVPRQQPLN